MLWTRLASLISARCVGEIFLEIVMTYRRIGTLFALTLVTPGLAVAQEAQTEASPAVEVGVQAQATSEGFAEPAAEAEADHHNDWEAKSAAQEAPRVAQTTATATTDAAYVGGSDHARMVRTFAVGYLGQAQLRTPTPGNQALVEVDAPIIGGRYWFSERMGIDAGLGFSTGGTTVTVGDAEQQQPDPFALALRVGVPFALLDSRHFVFEVVPEATFGFASNTIEAPMADFEVSSTHFDLGARAGAEVHFGFINVPQLALQAGVGLRFSHDSGSVDQGGDEVGSFSSARIATSVGNNPWDIFVGNIAALYYFGR